MLWLLWIAVGWTTVPDHVDVDNLDRWEAGMNQLLDGPQGCWELVGKASWEWDFGRFGSSRGDAAFIGRLRSGVWEGFHVESMGEERRGPGKNAKTTRVYENDVRFAPMFGQVGGGHVRVSSEEGGDLEIETDRQKTPGNLLRSALDELGSDVEWSYAQWDPEQESVIYTRTVPLGKGPRAKGTDISVVFPDGGPLPDELVVMFPESFKRGSIPRFRIENARVEMRGRPLGHNVMPVAETLKFDVVVLGFHFSAGQTIQYVRATPCGAARAVLTR